MREIIDGLAYTLVASKSFIDDYGRITKNNRLLQVKYQKSLELLRIDPYYPNLRTHVVRDPIFGHVRSSKVTGDLRIIWDFDKDRQKVILLLATGGHSGGHKIYK